MKEKDMLTLLRSISHGLNIQPIESGSTSLGIPDCWFAIEHINGWIELKEVSRSVAHRFTIPYRKGQLAWHTRWSKLAPTCPIITCLFLNERIYMRDRNSEKALTLEDLENNWVMVFDLNRRTHDKSIFEYLLSAQELLDYDFRSRLELQYE